MTKDLFEEWYGWLREFIEEKGLVDEYNEWKVKKGYIPAKTETFDEKLARQFRESDIQSEDDI